MDINQLKEKHKAGYALLVDRDLYGRLETEVHLLIKYIDNEFFLELFSENLFFDIRGVLGSFVRQDLRIIYSDMLNHPDHSAKSYYDREYTNLLILRKCATNLRYQVKSLVRMHKLKNLPLKSTYIREISRRLNGEIQSYYQQLSENYKRYFRHQFTIAHSNENIISLKGLDLLQREFDGHFLDVCYKFYQLSDAITFIRSLLGSTLEQEIRTRIATLFFERQEKLEMIIDYFIEDLKRNFLRMMDRQIRAGREYRWVCRGLEKFLVSQRFEKLLQQVIAQSVAILKGKQIKRPSPIDIF